MPRKSEAEIYVSEPGSQDASEFREVVEKMRAAVAKTLKRADEKRQAATITHRKRGHHNHIAIIS